MCFLPNHLCRLIICCQVCAQTFYSSWVDLTRPGPISSVPHRLLAMFVSVTCFSTGPASPPRVPRLLANPYNLAHLSSSNDLPEDGSEKWFSHCFSKLT